MIEQATAALATKQWRAQEQAAILLADLGHRPAGARLAELLSADRPEVFVTAAWAAAPGRRRLRCRPCWST